MSPLVPLADAGDCARDDDERVVRARARVAGALAMARGGRYASAERMLREALGVLERRRRYAGAARAAATLGELLRERGHGERAGAALRQARLLFDTAHSDSDRDVQRHLSGGEREDYIEARALLRDRSRAAQAPVPAAAVRADARLGGLAGELVALVRAGAPAGDQGALEQICRSLQRRTEARGVGVYGLRQTAPLASAGDADRRMHDTVRESVSRGQTVPLVTCGRECRTAVPIGNGDGEPGALVIRWARAPEASPR